MSGFLDSITSKGYSVVNVLDHAEIIPFVQQNLKRKTPSAIAYIAVNLAVLCLLVFKFGSTCLAIDNSLSNLGLGVFACVLLIPVHEFIHGCVYSLLGAKTVSYKAHIRKFVFYAMADKFVVNSRQFRLVAIAPFLIITILLMVGFLFASEPGKFIILGTLLLHTGACSGDFGLMSYFDSMGEFEMITYDDQSDGKSYFLKRHIAGIS